MFSILVVEEVNCIPVLNIASCYLAHVTVGTEEMDIADNRIRVVAAGDTKTGGVLFLDEVRLLAVQF